MRKPQLYSKFFRYIARTKKSDTLKTSSTFKYYLIIVFVCSYLPILAQQKPNIKAPLSQKQQDSSFLVHPIKDAQLRFQKAFKSFMNKQFTKHSNTALYLMGGLNMTNQSIGLGGYQSNFNYEMTDFPQGGFQSGFIAGFSIDGTYKERHQYALEINFNSLTPGTNYSQLQSLSPFLGTYSHFKADKNFYTLNVAAHYKKLIPLGDTSLRKFYFVIGPSLQTRLSAQSEDNQINNNYKRFLISGDIGLEFDNHSYFTLFLHYKRGLNSFTQTPIKTTISGFELGVKIKASDLF